MKFLTYALLIIWVFPLNGHAISFGDLRWGLSQEEVTAIIGEPERKTENKILSGSLKQTYFYRDNEEEITYELLFVENMLTNTAYKMTTVDGFPEEDIRNKYYSLTKALDEASEDPPTIEKIDNSAKKITYQGDNTKVTIVYFNTPIKADYVNRNAYLNVTYSNADLVLKAKVNNRRIDRQRGIK